MKKIIAALVVLVLLSCDGQKEIQLPIANTTIVADVKDHSPIYFFFETKGKDTIVDLNRKNSISSTHWIFNVDKRFSLRLVVPEIIKMQAKKEGSAHKNEASENYFSYMNATNKSLAFLPFTKVKFRMEKPKDGIVVYFSKNKIWLDSNEVRLEELQQKVNEKIKEKNVSVRFGFDQNNTFDDYIKAKIQASSVELPTLMLDSFTEDYIY
jgi:biopolymer transport protein ExbD